VVAAYHDKPELAICRPCCSSRAGAGGSRLWCRSHIQKREYGASHIFESAAKGHNEEVSMTTTFVVTSCQSWELARAKNSMAR